MCAHKRLRTSRAALLTKLTHPVVVDFHEWWGLEGVDAIGAHSRAGATPIEDFDGADAKEAVQGAPAQQWPASANTRERGIGGPPRSLRCLSRDTPARLTPWLCSGPC